MTKWQKYVMDCFKKEEFVDLPIEQQNLLGMTRYATYGIFVKDTMENCGCVAAATLSMLFKPKVVVEFGAQVGWTSLLLCRLNPDAQVYGIDKRADVKAQLGHDFPTGYIPMLHKVPNYSFVIGNSWEFEMSGVVGLCFIDADHKEEFVWKDCWRAWENRNNNGDWCIAFDDYHPSNPGVVKAVDKFCKEVGYELQKAWSWYWIGTKTATEEELKEVSI